MLICAIVSLVLGIALRRFRSQNVLVVSLMKRDVHVPTGPIGPIWLTLLTNTEHFFVEPYQAQLLVGVSKNGQIRIGGKELSKSLARSY